MDTGVKLQKHGKGSKPAGQTPGVLQLPAFGQLQLQLFHLRAQKTSFFFFWGGGWKAKRGGVSTDPLNSRIHRIVLLQER